MDRNPCRASLRHRVPWLLLACLLLAASGGSLVVAVQGVLRGPPIFELVALRPEIELGTVSPESTTSTSIRFQNETGAPINIRLVTASCGCTIMSKPPERLDTGELLELQARFVARGKTGRVGTRITVLYRVTTESHDRRTEVVLWASVAPDFVLTDEVLTFSQEAPLRDLRISATPGRQSTVMRVSVDHDAFEAHWERAAQTVRIAFTPDRWNDSSRSSATLSIETTSPTQSLILVPLRVSVTPHLTTNVGASS